MTHGPFPFFISGPEPTPEEQEAQRLLQERRSAEIAAFQHDFQRLFEELNEDQLGTVRTMLQLGLNHDHLLYQWDAMISWEMRRRFNKCVTCGVDHDQELLNPPPPSDGPDTAAGREVHTDPEPAPTAPLSPDTGTSSPVIQDRPRNVDGTIRWDKKTEELMFLYHLDDVYEESGDDFEPPIFKGFKCTGINGMSDPNGCGIIYPSLQDRMLKEPENCDGCFQRIKHG